MTTNRFLFLAMPVRLTMCLFVSALMVAGLSGCGSSRHVSAKRVSSVGAAVSGKGSGASGASQRIDVLGSLPAETRRLLEEARRWMGTSYRYGGSTRSGVDCSGLTSQIFVNALQIKLPRSSAQQSEYCRRIDRSELMEGDLVFFRTGSKGVSHVGMYVGDGRIIHSSTSRGVIVSSLDESYYRRTYHSSGRVERYYAMISGKTGKNKGKTDKNKGKNDKRKDKPAGAPDLKQRMEESPVSVPAEDLDRLLAGVSRNVSEKVSEKVGEKVAADPKASKAVSVAADLTAVASAAADKEKAADRVRKALEKKRRDLEDIIDQKVDSVISDYFD
ncbi:C40 family peptidase [Paramuribaculum intestinale]|uniref:C40 family peptidase n=1 Tax=Paramuribaculum intestinale TaxID=2094151 RepID=UPI0025A538EB|nr:NlpC/P60 family protein [Paramuribaculum intestinale]